MDCGVISEVCPQELEQGRYELRLKLDDCQAQWESQVSELERDVQELQAQVQRLSQSLSEAEREKSRLKHEHSEQSQRLGEQLQRVSDTYCTSHQPLFSSIAFIMTQHGPWVLIPRVAHTAGINNSSMQHQANNLHTDSHSIIKYTFTWYHDEFD